MSKRRASREPPAEVEPNDITVAGYAVPDGETTSPNGRATPAQPCGASNAAGAPGDGDREAGADPKAANTGKAGPQRTGVDTRQRGWYWHWNGIVTQYAPLIGLKGVGLLNSYTVWTDRRDQSPTRGYAFPSQQSEADFYGEDRSELITINKILVALDLIEIRKEMVQRTDPQGRKWKVPHNLYRVKDRPEGIELRTEDVLRVVELASRDTAVFRYLKRIFSIRFAPIDRDNVWHRILAEVADNATWQALTDKTAKIEARASARTRAGHKARGKSASAESAASSAQPHGDSTAEQNTADATPNFVATPLTTGHLSSLAFTDDEHMETKAGPTLPQATEVSASGESDVASSNTGLGADVDAVNNGSKGGNRSSAEATNNGRASVVAPGNATYHQEISTTTTTTTGAKQTAHRNEESRPEPAGTTTEHPPSSVAPEQGEALRAEHPGPVGLDDHAATLPAGEQPEPADESLATAERSLADPGAGGPLVDPSPLVVSIFEAANDRRSSPLERTLLAELERDADAPARAQGASGAEWVAAALREAVSSGSTFVAPKRVREIINRWATAADRSPVNRPAGIAPIDAFTSQSTGDATQPVRLPRGRSAAKVWQAVLDDLARVFDASSHTRLFSNSRITGYNRGTVIVQVGVEAKQKLAAEYQPLLQRHLERHIGNAVTVELAVAPAVEELPTDPAQRSISISAADAEQGRQLWRAVLSEIRPSISADDLVRLRGALPLGQDVEGRIVIGAPTSLVQRLIAGRCRTPIQSALTTLLGGDAAITVAASHEWSIDTQRSGG